MTFGIFKQQSARSHLHRTAMLFLVIGFLAGCTVPKATPPVIQATLQPSPLPSLTAVPTTTATITPSPTATSIVTPTWAVHPAKQLTAPILLYHHISVKDERYYVSPATFRQQMEILISLGYTGITIPQLVEVLQHGGALPERPVAITFDDGDLDVYQNAFPIMQELGLVGTFFVVGTRLDSNEFIQVDQLKEMTDAGWAIGCHSMTHIDLTLNHEALTYEAGVCKSTLEEKVGVTVSTFAYPFGTMDEFVAGKVAKYGYTSAVGLGISSDHTWGTLYYLSRLEVQNAYDLETFKALLPWVEEPAR